MTRYQYKVVPAPAKASRTRGVKGTDARFALTLEELMNQLAAEGWEYQRAETLPVEERSGLTGSATSYRNLLVFRRELTGAAAQPAPLSTLPSHEEEDEDEERYEQESYDDETPSGPPRLTASRGKDKPAAPKGPTLNAPRLTR